MKIISDKPIAFHIIDSANRDLIWRLFLAAALTRIGLTSVIAKGVRFNQWLPDSRNLLILGRLPTNEGCSGYEDPLLKTINQANAKVLFFHDEGAFYSRSTYIGSLIRSHMLQCAEHECVRKILFWGPFQERIARFLAPGAREKFMVVGAPRFDIYHPPYNRMVKMNRSDTDHTKTKKHILIVTRGSGINPSGMHPAHLGSRLRNLNSYGIADRSKVERVLFGKWAKFGIDAVLMVKGISELALAFPDEVFLVRPHPGENIAFYREAFEEYPNILVSGQGDLGTAMQKSKMVVGNDCTSGFETLLSGKPFINYRPSNGMLEEYSVYGLSKIGIIADDPESLIGTVRSFINSTTTTNEVRKSLEPLRKIIHNIDTPAIPGIIDIVRNEINELNEGSSVINTASLKIKSVLRDLKNRVDPQRMKHIRLDAPKGDMEFLWNNIVSSGLADKSSKIVVAFDSIIVSPK
jgi:surface carbohydrate biosynthesis protein